MPEEKLVKKKVLMQDPAHGAHLRLPGEAEKLLRHATYFDSVGDVVEAAAYRLRHKHTVERHGHAVKAAAFVETLGLSHEVKSEGYTFNDAVNFVAKVLHEHDQHENRLAEIKPLYARAHGNIDPATNDGAHVDLEKMNAPRDSAAEVIEALGLEGPAADAARALFAGKVV
jgi:uncharacterized protein YoaH (UPF0181 family)